MSSIEENKAVVKGFLEAGNNINGDLEKINPIMDKFFSPEFVHHSSSGEGNHDQLKLAMQMGYTGIPDMKHEIHDVIAEDDKVVVRFTTTGTHKGYLGNIPPSNNKISYSLTDTFRVSNGKIQEEWAQSDFLTLYQQMGVLPSNEEFIQAYIDSLK
jgi:predicted ester cyclase